MSVLCKNCHTLSQHLVPSIFGKRKKEKKEIQARKSPSEKLKNKLECRKNKSTILASNNILGVLSKVVI